MSAAEPWTGEGGRTVIFGGAGFIGSNLADHYLSAGRTVRIVDNLTRPGVVHNLRWLQARHGARLEVMTADVRDAQAVKQAVAGATQVFHFAAQVAVTTSLEVPVTDFEVNAGGTLNVLEALRAMERPAPLVFTSTNKVYGGMPGVELVQGQRRYEPRDTRLRSQGVDEACPLDFESPYGCSKGAADQYVLDYARAYGLRTVVFRMSCIYGPRQFGTEDQGWVAHFLLRTLEGQPLTLYGDGKQVRDILDVRDLVDALSLAQQHMGRLKGQAFNMGGGPTRAVSLLELLGLISQRTGLRPAIHFEDWRTGDQRYYVSDTRKFQAATGWAPRVGVREGVDRLHDWLRTLVRERSATGLGAEREVHAG
ncbi:NAD-dependent epimerase/dehydratase family protein [Corallococcus macrosporus]|uniref:CDP-paratose 2-epimerase n=2 Tax=Myxococcaceae TaxID=31 RepID=A0A250JRB6_9BACT|nr:NAD-dependent epimerase/dehydratase family protein [Corallococcus macrosporus]AEI62037.1 CDP-tyvelose-2-epimerase [Corallococcus macrosporus]ATB46170.1 CDP-paratose 2-epimerase [Corallococcus macrosporus DSM 14697]